MTILIKIALCAQYALKIQSRIRSHWSTHSLNTPINLNPQVHRFHDVWVFLVDVLPQIEHNVMDVLLLKEPVPISNNTFKFHLQGPLNVHAHDLSNGNPSKQAIHHPRLYFCRDLRCIPSTISLPDLTVNNKNILVCMSEAIIHDLCYVSHVVQVLDIEFASTIPLFGFLVLRLCESWLQLLVAIGNVLPLYVVLLRPTLHDGDDVQCLIGPVIQTILALICIEKGQTQSQGCVAGETVMECDRHSMHCFLEQHHYKTRVVQ